MCTFGNAICYVVVWPVARVKLASLSFNTLKLSISFYIFSLIMFPLVRLGPGDTTDKVIHPLIRLHRVNNQIILQNRHLPSFLVATTNNEIQLYVDVFTFKLWMYTGPRRKYFGGLLLHKKEFNYLIEKISRFLWWEMIVEYLFKD